jgi:hypothetical protein
MLRVTPSFEPKPRKFALARAGPHSVVQGDVEAEIFYDCTFVVPCPSLRE